MFDMSDELNDIESKVEMIKDHFGWTNAELARAAGVSRQAVGAWIIHGRMPSQEALVNLREKYGINDAWVLGRSKKMLLRDVVGQEIETLLREIEEKKPDEIATVLRILRSFLNE